MIACGHCGGRHATVAEVRGCSGAPADAPRSLDEPRFDEAANPASPEPTSVALAPDWDRLAGPDALGRNLLIAPDGPVPPPWADAPRIRIVDEGDPAILAELRHQRLRRNRVVIELASPLPPPDPALDISYWHLAPDTDLPGEAMRHLVLAHAVDARSPSAPSMATVDLAVAAGATVASDGLGDVVGPDGPLWCDGGPLDWVETDDGVPVVAMANLRVGSLRPVQASAPSAELAPDQLAAVAHGGAGARIIAPAGSGKTRVLTERARHLIRDRGIDPRSICLLAFNVRARAEMQERTTDLPGLEIRTLNSLALAIAAGRAPFVRPAVPLGTEVIDEHRVRRLLDGLVSGRRQAMADPMAVYLEALTATRLGLRAPDVVEREFAGDVREFPAVVAGYREALRRHGLLDFDEQILSAIEVLCVDPVARQAARRACQIVLVDEFQDLTPAHVLLVRLLAGPDAAVFGVGDDDQTIYGYAGASPAWLLDFADLFPGAGAHDLTINYRCAPAVVDGARTLLGHNRRRIDKTILPRPERSADPEALTVTDAADPSAATVAAVLALTDGGVRPRDIAVLTRVNATLLGPMLGLDAAGVPTTAPIDPRFLERTGVAGVLAWLRLATAPAKRLPGRDLETAIRRPPRGLRARLCEWVGEKRSIPELLELAGRLNEARDQTKVADFATDLARLRDLADDPDTDTATLLVAIRDEIGLGAALDNRLDASRRSVDRSAHGDDLAALLAVASLEPDPERFPAWLAERLQAGTTDPDGVQLSTIHRVKGREWPHVVVHDVTAGLFPHRLAADLEEERRVFHVAITRSSQRTVVVAGRPASPFVAQLHTEHDPDAPEPEPPRRPREAKPPPVDSPLRERLRAWRSETARDAGVPAYVIFNDATLDHLVADRPPDETALLDITGIGPVKVERHGADILEIIAAVDDG
ncbi:MAG: ATP-dependent DNA helicase UvrD2 [Actinomycetota bacterium]